VTVRLRKTKDRNQLRKRLQIFRETQVFWEKIKVINAYGECLRVLVPMKDVLNCEKLREAVEKRNTRRCPNGETRLGAILSHSLLNYASAEIGNEEGTQRTETT
jgi:hypothetical protein